MSNFSFDPFTEASPLELSQLNKGQVQAYDNIIAFLEDVSHDMFLLEGYAGTGKTFLVSKIIDYISFKHPRWKIAATAPTNKAVKVLEAAGKISSHAVTFMTIHRLLGLSEEITDEGKQIFVQKSMDRNTIDDYDVIVVDEVSMLNDELFKDLCKYSPRIKIIFMGDPAQIPPVGKTDCIPFVAEERDKYKIKMALLTEIMRQNESNPIVQASFTIRNNLYQQHLDLPLYTNINDQGHGIDFIDLSKLENKDKMQLLVKQYFDCDAFRENADHAKFIAWRNVIIDGLNDRIRKIIHKKDVLDKILIGEKLIADKPVVDTFAGGIIFQTNSEFEVIKFEVKKKGVRLSSGDHYQFQCYDCTVQYIDNEITLQKNIQIIHEDDQDYFEKISNKVKEHAIRSTFTARKFAWKEYYRFINTFARVKYNYAITAHKSQGSTYTNVFVMNSDLDKNSNVYERNRIKYTAFTRAAEKLFIIKN